jgi:hypothetical protein
MIGAFETLRAGNPAQDTAVILGREQARLREELDTARARVERASHVLQVRLFWSCH